MKRKSVSIIIIILIISIILNIILFRHYTEMGIKEEHVDLDFGRGYMSFSSIMERTFMKGAESNEKEAYLNFVEQFSQARTLVKYTSYVKDNVYLEETVNEMYDFLENYEPYISELDDEEISKVLECFYSVDLNRNSEIDISSTKELKLLIESLNEK